MSKLFSVGLLLTSATFLLGCQSTGGSISAEQAKSIGFKVQSTGYVAPPRSIVEVEKRYEISEYKRKTARTCNFDRYSPAKQLETARSRYDRAPELTNWYIQSKVFVARDYARQAYLKGNIQNAVKYAEWADRALQRGTVRESQFGWTGWNSIFAYRSAVYLANAGLVADAEEAESEGRSQHESIWKPNFLADYNSQFGYWADGMIQKVRGNLSGAESSLRSAIGMNIKAFSGVDLQHSGYFQRIKMSRLMIQGELAETLAKQGKLVDGEGVIRSAISGMSGYNADPLAEIWLLLKLSEVVYLQGRYEESRRLAELVVEHYNLHCAGWGLGAALARSVQAKALLALGEAHKASAIYQQLSKMLGENGNLLETRFGDDLHWAAVDLRSGKLAEAQMRLQKAKKRSLENLGAGSLREIVADGLLGLTMLAKGDVDTAVPQLDAAVTKLLTNGDGEASGSKSSWPFLRRLVIDGYMDFLGRDGSQMAVNRAFEISQGLQSGSVQQALRQNAARAAANTPELALLVRQSQDLEQQISALQDIQIRSSGVKKDGGVATAKEARAAISKLQETVKSLHSTISSKFPEFDKLMNPKPLTVTDTQAALSDGGSLLVIRTLRDKTYVWAVPKSGDAVFAIVDMGTRELSSVITGLREAVDPGAISSLGDIPAFDIATAYGLYQKILEPVKAGWVGSTNINLVAQGPMGQLPLSMLPTAPAKLADSDTLFAEYRDVPWLAKSHSVAMLPSVGALTSFADSVKAAGRRPFVGFGDPYFNPSQALAAAKQAPVQIADASTVRGAPLKLRNRPQTRSVNSADLGLLPRLPATAHELVSIATNMNSDPKTSVFLGKAANEKQVKGMKLDNVDVLAFATHGLVPGDLNGLDQPALALSAPKVAGVEGDGLLTMGEILALKLNADWVVLSACNTASAEGAGAEAVSGLGRAFFYAGARSLLVSNWPVHSGATAKLTTTLFYLQAKDKSLGRAQALQKTRLEMIEKGTQKDRDGKPIFSYAHPIFWAPFTIVGDGGRASSVI